MKLNKIAMTFNILIKKTDEEYVAHCLELDIVTTSKDFNQARQDIFDLIQAQVDYAFSNDNLNYLFRPAPAEVWQEFYSCKAIEERKIKLKSTFRGSPMRFVPPWIITRTCNPPRFCHA